MGILSLKITLSNNPIYRVKIVIENGLGSCPILFRKNWLWKLKLYKGYINLLLYEIVYIDMIMIVSDMKSDHMNKNTNMFDK